MVLQAWLYPLVICYIAIENGHLVSFPIKYSDFHSYVNVYQRVLSLRITWPQH